MPIHLIPGGKCNVAKLKTLPKGVDLKRLGEVTKFNCIQRKLPIFDLFSSDFATQAHILTQNRFFSRSDFHKLQRFEMVLFLLVW